AKRLRRTGRSPDLFRADALSRPSVPVDGDEHVSRSLHVRRRVERVDQHETVARLERERAHLVLPFLVPRRPAAYTWRDLLYAREATSCLARNGAMRSGSDSRATSACLGARR